MSVEIGEHLAVVGRRTLIVTAVRQHLDGQLRRTGPSERAPQQSFVAKEDGQASERLEVLHQMVAADVALEMPPQESGVLAQVC